MWLTAGWKDLCGSLSAITFIQHRPSDMAVAREPDLYFDLYDKLIWNFEVNSYYTYYIYYIPIRPFVW